MKLKIYLFIILKNNKFHTLNTILQTVTNPIIPLSNQNLLVKVLKIRKNNINNK
jgi:hypothetical protein